MTQSAKPADVDRLFVAAGFAAAAPALPSPSAAGAPPAEGAVPAPGAAAMAPSVEGVRSRWLCAAR